MEEFMLLALKEAKKAQKKGDVPIGAVIVKNGKIIAKGHNKKERKKIATQHAEIIAINKACRRLHTWRLQNCELYITMEPCVMCCGAIIQSRIGKIIYGVHNEQFGGIDKVFNDTSYGYKPQIIPNICEEKCKEIIQIFFKKKRK